MTANKQLKYHGCFRRRRYSVYNGKILSPPVFSRLYFKVDFKLEQLLLSVGSRTLLNHKSDVNFPPLNYPASFPCFNLYGAAACAFPTRVIPRAVHAMAWQFNALEDEADNYMKNYNRKFDVSSEGPASWPLKTMSRDAIRAVLRKICKGV